MAEFNNTIRRAKFWIVPILGLSVGIFSRLAGAQGESVDPSKFDISGVRLYMSAAEAVTALKKHYGPNIKIHVTKYDSQYKPGKRYAKELTYDNGSHSFSASFVEKFPPESAQPEAAVIISYFCGYKNTMADREQLLKSAIEKYGPPSLQGDNLVWCVLGQYGCDMGTQPVLQANTVSGIILQDAGYAQKMRDTYQRSGTTQPNF